MRVIVLSAAGLPVSSVALAQAPVYDTDQLPVFHGKVASYSLTPRDEGGRTDPRRRHRSAYLPLFNPPPANNPPPPNNLPSSH